MRRNSGHGPDRYFGFINRERVRGRGRCPACKERFFPFYMSSHLGVWGGGVGGGGGASFLTLATNWMVIPTNATFLSRSQYCCNVCSLTEGFKTAHETKRFLARGPNTLERRVWVNRVDLSLKPSGRSPHRQCPYQVYGFIRFVPSLCQL